MPACRAGPKAKPPFKLGLNGACSNLTRIRPVAGHEGLHLGPAQRCFLCIRKALKTRGGGSTRRLQIRVWHRELFVLLTTRIMGHDQQIMSVAMPVLDLIIESSFSFEAELLEHANRLRPVGDHLS